MALELASTRISVGNELGESMGYLLRRTKRIAEYIEQPNVLAAVEELVEGIDRHCAVKGIDPRFIEVDGIYARGLSYLVLTFEDQTPERLRRRH